MIDPLAFDDEDMTDPLAFDDEDMTDPLAFDAIVIGAGQAGPASPVTLWPPAAGSP